MGDLFEDLLSPDAYPEPRPASIERRDTHISAVYLAGDDVYKVKKPVDFGFLDFSSHPKRWEACEAEVQLNRRLAEGTYLDVAPIARGPDGKHRIHGPGAIVEHAVHMRRLPDAERADIRIARGALGPAEIERVAKTIARFHAACRSDERTAHFGGPEIIRVNVVENFTQTREVLDHYLSPEDAQEIERYQLSVLTERAATFEARCARGAVRDGHGDLRLEHCYLRPDGAVTILDCIEFNDRFRFADVACDLAFLTMDLAHHRRVDLAEHLLAVYAREANDFDLYGVVDFYESYRAYVRAKIATFLAENRDAPIAMREEAAAEARRYFLLALAARRTSALRPEVIAVGGLLAAGKSTLAGWISAQTGAPIVDADRTRKHMIGVEATTHVNDGAWSGAYDKNFTRKVYEEVLRRAEVVLASGRPIVIDASFRSAWMRLAAHALAKRYDVPFTFVECRAPAEICKARLAEREARGDSVSDGRVAIFDDFAKAWEPVVELPSHEHTIADTSLTERETHRRIRAHIATWPRGLAG
ncbi:MAG: AAA family ATPase [Polyangiaceae bacterium]